GWGDGEAFGPDVPPAPPAPPAPAGWLADAGLTSEPLSDPADWSTCTASTMASTQTTAAAIQPMTLARCGRAAAAGGRVPSAGSAVVRAPAPAARRGPPASPPAGGVFSPRRPSPTQTAAGPSHGRAARRGRHPPRPR